MRPVQRTTLPPPATLPGMEEHKRVQVAVQRVPVAPGHGSGLCADAQRVCAPCRSAAVPAVVSAQVGQLGASRPASGSEPRGGRGRCAHSPHACRILTAPCQHTSTHLSSCLSVLPATATFVCASRGPVRACSPAPACQSGPFGYRGPTLFPPSHVARRRWLARPSHPSKSRPSRGFFLPAPQRRRLPLLHLYTCAGCMLACWAAITLLLPPARPPPPTHY